MTPRRPLAAAVPLIFALWLTGCFPAISEGDPEALPTVTLEPSPTAETADEPTIEPTAEPTADADPAPIEPPTLRTIWMDADGLHEQSGAGDLLIGQRVPVRTGAYRLATWVLDYCYPGQAAYAAALPDDRLIMGGRGAPYNVIVSPLRRSGDIAGLTVVGKKVRTVEGVGVGSTRAELRTALGRWDESVTGFASTVYAWEDADTRIAFEILERPEDMPTYWGDDSVLGTVGWVRIQSTEVELWPVAGSDAGSPCPV